MRSPHSLSKTGYQCLGVNATRRWTVEGKAKWNTKCLVLALKTPDAWETIFYGGCTWYSKVIMIKLAASKQQCLFRDTRFEDELFTFLWAPPVCPPPQVLQKFPSQAYVVKPTRIEPAHGDKSREFLPGFMATAASWLLPQKDPQAISLFFLWVIATCIASLTKRQVQPVNCVNTPHYYSLKTGLNSWTLDHSTREKPSRKGCYYTFGVQHKGDKN